MFWMSLHDVEEGVVGTKIVARFAIGHVARSASGIVTDRAPAVANMWHRELSSKGGKAGASGRCEHAIWDGWSTEVAESFRFPPGSVAGSSVVLV